MNVRILLAASLTLAFATCAFAQDSAPAAPASGTADAAAPAADHKASNMKKHAMKHHAKHHRAHVAGDPANVDHSDDHMAVTNPTESKITVPPGQ